MSKSRKRIDGNQLSLLDLLEKINPTTQTPSEGSLDVKNHFLSSIINAIKNCSMSRWEIAGKMSALLGVEISKFQVDAWTAESKEKHRFPAIYLPAFCQAVGDFTPLTILAEKAGVFVLPGREVLNAELAKRICRRDEENKEIKKIKVFIKEMETDRRWGRESESFR